MPPRPGFWWVYILERADGSWYTGISTDPRRRFEQHRKGQGAKANKVSPPQRLVCLEPAGAYPQALRREAQIKGLSKEEKRLYARDTGGLAAPDEGAPWLHQMVKKKRGTKKPE